MVLSRPYWLVHLLVALASIGLFVVFTAWIYGIVLSLLLALLFYLIDYFEVFRFANHIYNRAYDHQCGESHFDLASMDEATQQKVAFCEQTYARIANQLNCNKGKLVIYGCDCAAVGVHKTKQPDETVFVLTADLLDESEELLAARIGYYVAQGASNHTRLHLTCMILIVHMADKIAGFFCMPSVLLGKQSYLRSRRKMAKQIEKYLFFGAQEALRKIIHRHTYECDAMSAYCNSVDIMVGLIESLDKGQAKKIRDDLVNEGLPPEVVERAINQITQRIDRFGMRPAAKLRIESLNAIRDDL